MGSPAVNPLIGLLIFFLLLTSIFVGLRLWVRLRLKRAAFGWDDVFLAISYVGFVLFAAFASVSMHYGIASFDGQPWYDPVTAKVWTHVMNDTCMIISGTVKISVAMVLYRILDHRPLLQAMIIVDILICSVFAIVTSLIISLGCTGTYISPYSFNKMTCVRTLYAQESAYALIVVFHVIFPAALFWNVQIRNGAKVPIIMLFSIGLVSAIAVLFKLRLIVQLLHNTDPELYKHLWIQAVQWASVEHGSSLFAASILTLKPIYTPFIEKCASFSDSVSRSYTAHRESLLVRRQFLATLVSPRRKSSGAGTEYSMGSGSSSRKPSMPTLDEDAVAKMGYKTTLTVVTSANEAPWAWGGGGSSSSAYAATTGFAGRPKLDVAAAAAAAAAGDKGRSLSYDCPLSPTTTTMQDGGGRGGETREAEAAAPSAGSSRDTPDYFMRSSPGAAAGHRRTLTVDEHLRVLEPVYASWGGGLTGEPSSPGGRNWFDDRRWSYALFEDEDA